MEVHVGLARECWMCRVNDIVISLVIQTANWDTALKGPLRTKKNMNSMSFNLYAI